MGRTGLMALSLLFPALVCGCHLLLPLSPSQGQTVDGAASLDGRRADGPPLPLDGSQRDLGDRSSGADRTRVPLSPILLQGDADDGEYQGDWPHPTGESGAIGDPPGLYMGFWEQPAKDYTWGHFRFWLPFAVDTAALCEVRLSLPAQDASNAVTTWNGTPHALRILIEDSQAPGALALDNQPGGALGKPVRATTVRWPSTGGLSWTAGVQRSPDLTPLLRDLAGSGTLVAGSGLRLWIRGDFQGGNAEVCTYDASDPRYGALPSNEKTQLLITLCR